VINKKKILFIINPISGTGKQKIVEQLLDKDLDKTLYDFDISYTEKAKHAIEISKNSVNDYNIIAAVGGDGSVQEVGKSLIGTNTTLAIIPIGSGNGLARDLKISMNIKKAILLINQGKTKLIDTIKINNEYFLGTAGVGFDAYISWKFDEASTRGILTYILVALKGFFNYKSLDYTVNYNGKEKIISKGMLVTFSNSKQYGNNILISPNSKIDDGLVRLVAVKKFPIVYLPFFAFYLLSKQIDKFKFTEELAVEKLILTNPKTKIHMDGEPVEMDNKLEVEVVPKSLSIIVP
jgi:YegS/Rv2252/BmrU family lipid kinase